MIKNIRIEMTTAGSVKVAHVTGYTKNGKRRTLATANLRPGLELIEQYWIIRGATARRMMATMDISALPVVDA